MRRASQTFAFDVQSVLVATSVVIALLTVASDPASAQFNNGAVIVTVPSTEDEAKPSTVRPIKPPPRQQRAAPKQRTAVRKVPRRAPAPRNTAADELKIAILVNDDPITEYEIGQRAALLAGQAGVGKQAQAYFQQLIKQKGTNDRLKAILQRTIEANPGRSRDQILAIFERQKKAFAQSLQRRAVDRARKNVMPGLRRKAAEELIEERLKLQAAKQAKVLASDLRVNEVLKSIAKRNNLSYDAFKKQLKQQGTDIHAMRSRLRAQLSWMQLVNAKFGRFVDINQKAIDESVQGGSDAAQISLQLHRFLFRLPNKIDQRIMAQRMLEAEQLRSRFAGCAASRTLATGDKGVIFQDLGYKAATSVPEPTRSLLINSPDGAMVPPVTTTDGVALYAVCARRSGSKSFEAQAAVERNLRQELTEIYARKYISDLRREAHIEYRNR